MSTSKCCLSFACIAALCCMGAHAQSSPATPANIQPASQLVLIDTDIGDDIDDVFALGLALSSPELKVLGITSAWADAPLKARLVDRLLCETGRSDIPVAVGIDKRVPGQGPLSQARWAERQPDKPHSAAVEFVLDQIKLHPGEITLIGLGPLTNLEAAIERDPATFRKLKRIVLMGGSIRKGYGETSSSPQHGPDAEYNIAMDIPAAQAVFTAGVPLYVMPLDSTQIGLDELNRQKLFTLGTNLTEAMELLYTQWSFGHHLTEPILFDDMPVAFAVDPELCPVTPMRIEVDAKGYTRELPGKPNTFVCLNSSTDAFFDFFMPRLMKQRLYGTCAKLP